MNKLGILVLVMVLVVGSIALIASFATITDFLRRRRGEDHDGEVIADSGLDLESDVGKPPFDH